ncbi:MFS transporter [Paraburkholderia sartisoli]|uniref:MFS transporter, ACS family, glucarate transporter n=1 Tax=Paraburkholderia sartisoli TaxID=83784 RepID=A0A1H4H224_9BURK|nr:MFS transporter [Paraburkholderia sartisoli]SEB15889.1 MFS transporter, ACS family, glucarate transporter [Paraburkholderia sartisoli]
MKTFDIPAAPARATTARAGHFRYYILGLIFFVTVLNYADRATLSIAGTFVAKDLGLTAASLGIVFSAFGWAYAIGQIPGGWLLDRFGAKRVYGTSIVLWSLFTISQGTVSIFSTTASATIALFIMRFMLGLVEAPAFPGNARVVATWFPTSERGTASALFNSAQYLAVVIFTPLMAWLTHAFGWHHVFFFMGGLGLVAACIWFATMGDPKTHSRMSKDEFEFIAENGALVGLDTGVTKDRRRFTRREISTLFTSRMLWAIYIGQYCITALTYFFITWFPIYLVKERGMNIMTVGMVAALPAICGFSGGIIGGALSDYLIRRGFSVSFARKTPFMIGMVLATVVMAAPFAVSNTAVVIIMSLAFFGKGLGAIGWAVVADVAPREMTGLSGGVFNGIGNTAGIVTPIVIGFVVASTGSFDRALWFVGAHGIVAILAYGVLAGRFKRIELKV